MGIEISDEVRDKIKEILKKNPGKYLRIVIEGTGCAGPYLRLSLDEAGTAEVITRANGIDVLISDDVKKYAEASTINVYINQL
jgi:Fe-S cluster assembly iron-binding protein IscA